MTCVRENCCRPETELKPQCCECCNCTTEMECEYDLPISCPCVTCHNGATSVSPANAALEKIESVRCELEMRRQHFVDVVTYWDSVTNGDANPFMTSTVDQVLAEKLNSELLEWSIQLNKAIQILRRS